MINFNDKNEITGSEKTSAILAVPLLKSCSESDAEWYIAELRGLAEAAGIEVFGILTQRIESVNAASYIGSGKLEELSEFAGSSEASLIVFNEELTGMQLKNIEDACGVKVIDRTMLILDIFASRASTAEGRLQVEMAQLKYRMPRLLGFGRALSRLGGGIGTRGPGEKKLETDRRHIQNRIYAIKRELEELEKTRGTQRNRRESSELPVAALVGYTNSGKSSIMNRFLSLEDREDKRVFEEDVLFATLDTAHRLIDAGDNRKFILIDTVGFVSKLPHALIEAFRGTLEEIKYADLLINVVDSSDPEADRHRAVTEQVMAELGAGDKPVITAYNKMDLLEGKDFLGCGSQAVRAEGGGFSDSVFISAKTGEGTEILKDKIKAALFGDLKLLELLIPHSRGDIVSRVCAVSRPKSIEYTEFGTKIAAELNFRDRGRFREYIIS